MKHAYRIKKLKYKRANVFGCILSTISPQWLINPSPHPLCFLRFINFTLHIICFFSTFLHCIFIESYLFSYSTSISKKPIYDLKFAHIHTCNHFFYSRATQHQLFQLQHQLFQLVRNVKSRRIQRI